MPASSPRRGAARCRRPAPPPRISRQRRRRSSSAHRLPHRRHAAQPQQSAPARAGPPRRAARSNAASSAGRRGAPGRPARPAWPARPSAAARPARRWRRCGAAAAAARVKALGRQAADPAVEQPPAARRRAAAAGRCRCRKPFDPGGGLRPASLAGESARPSRRAASSASSGPASSSSRQHAPGDQAVQRRPGRPAAAALPASACEVRRVSAAARSPPCTADEPLEHRRGRIVVERRAGRRAGRCRCAPTSPSTTLRDHARRRSGARRRSAATLASGGRASISCGDVAGDAPPASCRRVHQRRRRPPADRPAARGSSSARQRGQRRAACRPRRGRLAAAASSTVLPQTAGLDRRRPRTPAATASCQSSWKVPLLPPAAAGAGPRRCRAGSSRCSRWLRSRSVGLRRSRSRSRSRGLGRQAQPLLLRAARSCWQRHGRASRRARCPAARRRSACRGSAAAAASSPKQKTAWHRLVQFGQARQRAAAQRRQRLGQAHRLDHVGRRGVEVLARAAGAPPASSSASATVARRRLPEVVVPARRGDARAVAAGRATAGRRSTAPRSPATFDLRQALEQRGVVLAGRRQARPAPARARPRRRRRSARSPPSARRGSSGACRPRAAGLARIVGSGRLRDSARSAAIASQDGGEQLGAVAALLDHVLPPALAVARSRRPAPASRADRAEAVVGCGAARRIGVAGRLRLVGRLLGCASAASASGSQRQLVRLRQVHEAHRDAVRQRRSWIACHSGENSANG